MKLALPPSVLEVCELLPPNHIHCVHGHSQDCPDPGDCVYLELEGQA